MRMRNVIAAVAGTLVALCVTAVPAPALELDEILASAHAASPRVAASDAWLERASRRLLAEEDPSLLTWSAAIAPLTIGSSELPDGSTNEVREVTESVTFSAAEPYGTSATVRLTTDFADDSDYDFLPSISFSQPLRDLFWNEPDSADVVRLYADVDAAALSLAQARIAVSQSVVNELATLLGYEYALAEGEHELASARADLTEAEELQSYREGSAALDSLRTQVYLAERKVSFAESALTVQQEFVRELTALRVNSAPRFDIQTFNEHPAVLTSAVVASLLDRTEAASAGVAAVNARWDVQVAEAEHFDEYGSDPPQVTVNASASKLDADSSGDDYWGTELLEEYSGSVAIDFDFLSFSLGGTWAPDQEARYLTFELAYAPPNTKQYEATRAGAEDKITAAQLDYNAAVLATNQQLVAYVHELADYESQWDRVVRQLAQSRIAFDEVSTYAQAGLRDDEDLADARWTVQAWEFELQALAYKRLSTSMDISHLFGGEEIWNQR
jgi:outer membrane protein TolC